MTPIQKLVDDLQAALSLQVVTGTISLNLNERTLQSVKTETYTRVTEKPVDKRMEFPRHLTR